VYGGKISMMILVPNQFQQKNMFLKPQILGKLPNYHERENRGGLHPDSSYKRTVWRRAENRPLSIYKQE